MPASIRPATCGTSKIWEVDWARSDLTGVTIERGVIWLGQFVSCEFVCVVKCSEEIVEKCLMSVS